MLKLRYTFDRDTEITGYMKLKVWVAALDNIDADVYARVSKLNREGERVFNRAAMTAYSGPNTMLRASLRELDEDKSTPCEPFHTFNHPQLLTRGVPVELELGFWPTSLLFHAGESLELILAGFDYLASDNPLEVVSDTRNRGTHMVFAGGAYDSYLLIPKIPERAQ